jgi:hypothetical protein
MPVIINEFEAVAEAPASATAPDQSTADGEKHPEPIEPDDLAPALRVLAIRTWRLWAH